MNIPRKKALPETSNDGAVLGIIVLLVTSWFLRDFYHHAIWDANLISKGCFY